MVACKGGRNFCMPIFFRKKYFLSKKNKNFYQLSLNFIQFICKFRVFSFKIIGNLKKKFTLTFVFGYGVWSKR